MLRINIPLLLNKLHPVLEVAQVRGRQVGPGLSEERVCGHQSDLGPGPLGRLHDEWREDDILDVSLDMSLI